MAEVIHRIRTMGAPHWLALFGLVLVSWILVFLMMAPAELRQAGVGFGPEFWEELCRVALTPAGYLRLWAMWAIMGAAMMLPTALPLLTTYHDLNPAQRDVALLVGGYLAVWTGFAGIAAAAQMGLTAAGLLTPFGDSLSPALTGGLLIMAGAYQFSPMKEACLSRCRAPLAFFMSHWDEGPLRNGVRHGLDCLGCCWALMALAFAGGVMNLAFMGLATLVMVLEKLPDIGAPLTRPLGGVLILGGAAVWITAIV